MQEAHEFGAYELRIHRGEFGGCFEVFRHGHRVYARNGWKFELGRMYAEGGEGPVIPMGRSVVAGSPNLVLREWTGDAHCCYVFSIFDIGSTFRRIATLDVQHSENAGFQDLDQNGRLYVVAQDWTLAYWGTAFFTSPRPTVILRWQNDKYALAVDKMRKPRPAPEQLKTAIERIHAQYRASESREAWWRDLWSTVLDLIYSGQAEAALNFFDAAWPAEDKHQTRRDFLKKLAESPHWSEIKALNGGKVWE